MSKMEIKVNLEKLIETIIDITVEHYVDECEDGMRYTHKYIKDENIENMKASLVKKFIAIFKEGNKCE